MRIVVVGAGVMGRNHVRVLRGMQGVEVPVVCDPVDPGIDGVCCCADLDSLLERYEFDAAVVAVPTPMHLETCMRLIEAGTHLLIEKPVATTSAEASLLQEAARKAGVKTAVGHIERFNPVVQSLKRELADSVIYSVSFTRVGHMPPRQSDVGVLSDLAVHDIDLLRFITGKAIRHTTVYRAQSISDHYEDSANVSFELEGNTLATITTNWLTPFKRRKIEVTTADGYFDVDLIAQELSVYSAYKDDDTYLTRPCRVRKGEPLANELEAFVAYLETGEGGDLATIEDSGFTLGVLEGGHRDTEAQRCMLGETGDE